MPVTSARYRRRPVTTGRWPAQGVGVTVVVGVLLVVLVAAEEVG